MSAAELSHLIWEEEALRAAVKNVTVRAASFEFANRPLVLTDVKVDWFHLLRCASIFTESHDEYFHDIGLRIVHSCLTLDASDDAKGFAVALLAKAASNPTIDVAVKRGMVPHDIIDRLPRDLQFEISARQIAATINIDSPQEFIGNDFQNSLWRALAHNDWVSASAPTSAGKSYILEKWIEAAVHALSQSTTFFLVPTRALISQVESDLREMLPPESGINISSLPLAFSEPTAHNIYIYTQERFHLYLMKDRKLTDVDLIIVDEAQQIGASRRGVLLQQVLELASQRFPEAKVLFASPSTSNPQALLDFAPDGKRTDSIAGTKPTVNQNLIWAEPTPRKPTQWNFHLMADGVPELLGQINLPHKPSITQKLPFIAYAVGGDGGGNVIYVNRASDAEAVAEILCQFVAEESQDEELTALSELCERAVHPRFALRRFVRKGVAFHYGNIPQLIRTEVERLFSSGKIKFLVCTSTLVEGVNLSCRNIFMRNPKRGVKDLMTPEDFWNLAGRAGRWGKEFQGNIYCIDPRKSNEWYGGSAPRRKQKNTIRIATQRLAAEFHPFLEYVRNGARALGTTDRFHEHLLSYLIFRLISFGSLGGTPTTRSLDEGQLDELTNEIQATIDGILVPVEIVSRNPGINPWGLSALYEYFSTKSDEHLEDLLPVDPLTDVPVGDDGEEIKDAAIENYIAIFSRITKYLEGRLGEGNAAFGNVLLVIHWMRGYPLNRIIDRQLRYWSRRDANKGSTAVIRETMEKVEKVARFETPKYLHAYIDVLVHVLEQRGRRDLIPTTDDFWLYLEFGVSKRTQLSLMSLGLSRSSVTALSDYIKDDELSEAESLSWLVNNSWPEFGLPRLVELEIETVLRRYGRLKDSLSPKPI